MESLIFLSGKEIPFPEGNINITQPTLRGISVIGESNFFMGCQLLNFSRYNILGSIESEELDKVDDFDILLSILMNTPGSQSICVTLVLSLLFPTFQIHYELDGIHLDSPDCNSVINKNNYPSFKKIFIKMFCLGGENSSDFNPKNKAAQKIAEKLRKGREKANKSKGVNNEELSVFNRYISVLVVGLKLNLYEIFEWTPYQMYDIVKRFLNKENYDVFVKSKMAGAKDIEDVDNWMNELHP